MSGDEFTLAMLLGVAAGVAAAILLAVTRTLLLLVARKYDVFQGSVARPISRWGSVLGLLLASLVLGLLSPLWVHDAMLTRRDVGRVERASGVTVSRALQEQGVVLVSGAASVFFFATTALALRGASKQGSINRINQTPKSD